MKICNLIIAILLCISCSSSDVIITNDINLDELYFPTINSSDWETINPESLNWNLDKLNELYTYLDNSNTKGFIILKNGRIVVEKYFNGASENDNLPWYSAGKTLTAFSVGIAQEEGFLNINDSSRDYLGNRWSNLTDIQEQNIKVKDHLKMTTGLDYTNTSLSNCTSVSCLNYLNEPNTFWYYHNAPYTLIQNIISGAVNSDFTTYFNLKIRDKIGMQGAWNNIGFSSIYFSNLRSMARFGLLNLNNGKWNTTHILSDVNYFSEMTNTSQNMNKAYGYLWWLNGKDSFRVPSSTNQFQGKLIPNAPDDLIAGLGKNDQKLYVVPSQKLVIVRMGDSANQSFLGPSSFDNELWIKLNEVFN